MARPRADKKLVYCIYRPGALLGIYFGLFSKVGILVYIVRGRIFFDIFYIIDCIVFDPKEDGRHRKVRILYINISFKRLES